MMKVFIINLFLISLSISALSQVALEKILTEKKSVPGNWVDVISRNDTWKVIDFTYIGDRSRKVYPFPNSNKLNNLVTYKFSNDSITKNPWLVNKFQTLPITYFPNENTFFINYTIDLNGKPFVERLPFQVYYLDSSNLIIEHLNISLFDYDTGKILSDEEYQKKMNEKSKEVINRPGKYYVSDKVKIKNKSQESVRMVELLSLK